MASGLLAERLSSLVVTTEDIFALDATHLKQPGVQLPLGLSLGFMPTAMGLVSDSGSILMASARGVHKYTPDGKAAGIVFQAAERSHPISALTVKDKGGTVIFAQNNKIHVCDAASGKAVDVLEGHSSSITSLSLSGDGTLLASTSMTVHVHNLSQPSHTILRGLPTGKATCATFHPTRRTLLFIGIGRQFVLYDTSSKPAAPTKVVSLGGSAAGDIVAIECSPFSKSLVAAVSAGGIVGILDIEKEKPLVRTVDLKMPLTSLAFQHDTAGLVVGTESGKLLVLDLRNLDKPPHELVLSKKGAKITGIVIHKRARPSPSAAATVIKTVKPPGIGKNLLQDSNGHSPNRAVGDTKGKNKTSTSPNPPRLTARKPASPVREHLTVPRHDTRNMSVRVETVTSITARRGQGAVATKVMRNMKENGPESGPNGRSPGSSRDASPRAVVPLRARPQEPQLRPQRIPATNINLVPQLGSRRVSSNTAASSRASETPSPTFPSDNDTQSPVLSSLRPGGSNVLGFGTPGRVGDGKGLAITESIARKVGWAVDAESDEGETVVLSGPSSKSRTRESSSSEAESISTPLVGGTPSAAQLSPARRPAPSSSSAVQFSPVRQAFATQGHTPQTVLRAVVEDAMYEYRQETKEEIKSLHIDLVRMGITWKRELRSLVGEYFGDLQSLRDENQKLRAENDRFRRGY